MTIRNRITLLLLELKPTLTYVRLVILTQHSFIICILMKTKLTLNKRRKKTIDAVFNTDNTKKYIVEIVGCKTQSLKIV